MTEKAKKASLLGQIVMAAWIAVWSGYTFISGKNIPMVDILYSGIAIAGAFSPVYISIILDKLSELIDKMAAIKAKKVP